MNALVPRDAAALASPDGRRCHQTARIDRIERHVRALGRIHRRFERRLIVEARFRNAARKIEQRLLLRKRRQHLRGGFERGQLFIGVEDVELGLVGVERRAGVFAGRAVAAVARDARQFARRADLEALHHFFEPIFIVGEILDDLQRPCARGHDRHDIGRLHLLANELQRGLLNAALFRNLPSC